MLRRSLLVFALGISMVVAPLTFPSKMFADLAIPGSSKPAPGFTLTDSKGSSVKLSDYKGKIVLLNFWATWCHGCQIEIPWFIEFQDRYRDRGLAVIGVSMDDDGWKSVKPWIAQKKVNYAIVIGTQDLGKLYGLAGMPITLLIDRGGNIATTYSGVVNKVACENKIRALLNDGPKNARE
ncbi:MAG: TlpA disulfide reductase family protein [Candidatus Acidiferrum sp.]